MPASKSWKDILDGVEEPAPTTFEPIETGKYTGLLVEATGHTQDDGKQYINTKWKLVSEGKFKNRLVWARWYFTSASAGITTQSTRHFGLTIQYLTSKEPTIEQMAAMVEGYTAEIYVKHTKNGEYDNYNVSVNSIVSEPGNSPLNNPLGLPVPNAGTSSGLPMPTSSTPAPPPGVDPWSTPSFPDDAPF